MYLQVAGKIENSLSNGVGMRYVLFLSGCPHKCKGCHNPETWDYNYGDKISVQNILKEIKDNMPIIKGVTFSGGEPFEQAYALRFLAREIKKDLGLDIWCYTGYKHEDLIAKNKLEINNLLNYIDVLVDGPFIEELKEPNLHKGSSNQRVLKLKNGKII